MSKFYAIKYYYGELHKSNLGQVVYFTNKKDVQTYMKYNHYSGEIVEFDIDVKKDQRIVELEQENENYQKLINYICNKYRVGNLKELDEMYQATTESLDASRKYLDEETSKRWTLEKQIEELEASNINIIQNKEVADIVIAEYEKEVKQLKQQLAEKDETNKLVSEQLKDMERSKLAWENKYFKLEKQLAEKDKEHKKAMRTSLNDFLTLEVEFKEKKISFAVEQLEKAKELAKQTVFYGYMWGDKKVHHICEDIDNQIKQLKEGK